MTHYKRYKRKWKKYNQYKSISNKRYKNSYWLKKRYKPYQDTDKDGVINWNDCYPFDKERQGQKDKFGIPIKSNPFNKGKQGSYQVTDGFAIQDVKTGVITPATGGVGSTIKNVKTGKVYKFGEGGGGGGGGETSTPTTIKPPIGGSLDIFTQKSNIAQQQLNTAQKLTLANLQQTKYNTKNLEYGKTVAEFSRRTDEEAKEKGKNLTSNEINKIWEHLYEEGFIEEMKNQGYNITITPQGVIQTEYGGVSYPKSYSVDKIKTDKPTTSEYINPTKSDYKTSKKEGKYKWSKDTVKEVIKEGEKRLEEFGKLVITNPMGEKGNKEGYTKVLNKKGEVVDIKPYGWEPDKNNMVELEYYNGYKLQDVKGDTTFNYWVKKLFPTIIEQSIIQTKDFSRSARLGVEKAGLYMIDNKYLIHKRWENGEVTQKDVENVPSKTKPKLIKEAKKINYNRDINPIIDKDFRNALVLSSMVVGGGGGLGEIGTKVTGLAMKGIELKTGYDFIREPSVDTAGTFTAVIIAPKVLNKLSKRIKTEDVLGTDKEQIKATKYEKPKVKEFKKVTDEEVLKSLEKYKKNPILDKPATIPKSELELAKIKELKDYGMLGKKQEFTPEQIKTKLKENLLADYKKDFPTTEQQVNYLKEKLIEYQAKHKDVDFTSAINQLNRIKSGQDIVKITIKKDGTFKSEVINTGRTESGWKGGKDPYTDKLAKTLEDYSWLESKPKVSKWETAVKKSREYKPFTPEEGTQIVKGKTGQLQLTKQKLETAQNKQKQISETLTKLKQAIEKERVKTGLTKQELKTSQTQTRLLKTNQRLRFLMPLINQQQKLRSVQKSNQKLVSRLKFELVKQTQLQIPFSIQPIISKQVLREKEKEKIITTQKEKQRERRKIEIPLLRGKTGETIGYQPIIIDSKTKKQRKLGTYKNEMEALAEAMRETDNTPEDIFTIKTVVINKDETLTGRDYKANYKFKKKGINLYQEKKKYRNDKSGEINIGKYVYNNGYSKRV